MLYNEEYVEQMLIAEEEDRKDRKILALLASMIVVGSIYISVLGTMMIR